MPIESPICALQAQNTLHVPLSLTYLAYLLHSLSDLESNFIKQGRKLMAEDNKISPDSRLKSGKGTHQSRRYGMKRIIASMFALMALCTISFAGNSADSSTYGERAGAFSISPFVGWYNYDETQLLYTRPLFGFRLGYDFTSHWAAEVELNYASTEYPIANGSSEDVTAYSYRLDLLYNFMPCSMLDPYLAAGPGATSLYSIYPDAVPGKTNNDFSVDVGGGLKWFLSESFAVRGDVRHLFIFNNVNVDPNNHTILNNWQYTAGVDFLFGGKKCKKAPEAMATEAPAPMVAAAPEAPLEPIPAYEPTPEKTKYFVYLHNVEFDIGSANIRPQYRDELARVGDFMKKYPATNAVIEGYTDSVGTDEYNMQLSQQRADSVVKFLEVNFGIDSSRLSAKGYGKTMPVATNTTWAGRQANRHIKAIIDGALDVAGLTTPPDMLAMSLNIEFDPKSAEIQPAYYDKINQVGDFMKQYPTTSAIIEGHTDNAGTEEQLLALSQERAERVVDYLVNKYGIDRSRLTAKGYGDTRRIAYNTTPEGRQRNRRINAIIDFPLAK